MSIAPLRRGTRPNSFGTSSEVRYEVLPLPDVEEQLVSSVDPGRSVTVTASPKQGQQATFDLAERLVRYGFHVVPHISARLVVDRVHLKELLDRAVGAGISELFVVAGDPARPVGDYPDSLSVLRAMADLGYGLRSRPNAGSGPEPAPGPVSGLVTDQSTGSTGFDQIGIAGYPEGHPKISDDVLIQSMWDKKDFASYVVSQICFDPVVLSRWVRRLRERGIRQRLLVGVPGPSSVSRLLRISKRVGVGDSMKFLGSHGAGMLRLVRPGQYTPDRMLDRLFARCADELDGMHVYTFNNVAAAESWWVSRRAPTLLEIGA